jgi:DNA topoisomerase-1
MSFREANSELPERAAVPAAGPAPRRLAGLRLESRTNLSIRRVRRGDGYAFVRRDGRVVRDPATLRRLKALAVPPAYEDVRYARDTEAHLQAVGRDAAGRWQYRYHPDWEKVREARKARRLTALVHVLPKIRRSVAQHLSGDQPVRAFALAAVIELVARTAIRPGHESYVKLNKTRGATTLLKSNVRLEGDCLVLSFRGKGGKSLRKECSAAVLVRAVERLRELPGSRLFQYRDDDGSVKVVTANHVNAFLREIAGIRISLKDFRTLMACAAVIESLARVTPADSARARRLQVLDAVRAAADELANTPAICRRSYVHDSIVTAFENRLLERFASTLKGCRSPARREQVLAQVLALGR